MTTVRNEEVVLVPGLVADVPRRQSGFMRRRHETDCERVLATVKDGTCAEHASSADLLGDYLPALLAAAASARRLTVDEIDSCRAAGGEAARSGTALPTVVDVYLTATRRMWPHLPDLIAVKRGREVQPRELWSIGEHVLRAVDDAVGALAGGYVEAQRQVVRREEAGRRELVDDLLGEVADVGSLLERAEPFGLRLSASHVVAVAETGEPMANPDRITGWVEDAVRARFGKEALVATKDGRLACVVKATGTNGQGEDDDPGHALSEIVGRAVAELAPGGAWRVGLGRSHAGPRGVFRSYREALEALDVADRLGMADRVARAQDLLVYRVLLRDETAIAELVNAVLTPLLRARGGPGPLLETLEAYFSSGGNAAEAARKLHLSIRAVTYRLRRVQELTGYAVSDPAQRLPVEVAVMGARLLDWPKRGLTSD